MNLTGRFALSSSYADIYKIVEDYFSEFSKDEQNNFFG